MTCLACVNAAVSGVPSAVTSSGAPPVDAGQAGASALREYRRRHDARERHAREKLGGLGGLLTTVIDEPQSTRAWKQGGDGEARVGARLAKLLEGTDVGLLHDRRVPGHGRANIDHIAVGPGGITVVDTKTHRGRIRRDWAGGLFVDRRTILRIDGRDQTKLIDGIEKQIGHVRAVLAERTPDLGVEIAGALCFPVVDGLPILRRIQVRGILVDGPERVAKLASRPGVLTPDAIERIWAQLGRAFPAA